jgi:hypothetical protein
MKSLLVESPAVDGRDFAVRKRIRVKQSQNQKQKNPARWPGFSSIRNAAARDSLPGRMFVQRSARTRRHASSHAGAGQDIGGIDGCGHGASSRASCHHDGIFAAMQHASESAAKDGHPLAHARQE